MAVTLREGALGWPARGQLPADEVPVRMRDGPGKRARRHGLRAPSGAALRGPRAPPTLPPCTTDTPCQCALPAHCRRTTGALPAHYRRTTDALPAHCRRTNVLTTANMTSLEKMHSSNKKTTQKNCLKIEQTKTHKHTQNNKTPAYSDHVFSNEKYRVMLQE